MHFLRKLFMMVGLVLALVMIGQTVFAAGNISTTQKFSQLLNHDIDQNGVNDFLNWVPTCGSSCPNPVTVTDTAITGDIFGESIGWIRLNPSTDPGLYPPPAECNNNIGVKNTCSGILSGCAFGETASWVNFSPANATGVNQPKINTTTGQITGMVWSENFDWIELSSPTAPSAYPGYNPSLGLVTTWNGCSSVTNGVCGSSNAQSLTNIPSTGLCSTGTASTVSSTSGGWEWSCAGSGGGTTASCSATRYTSPPVDGGSPIMYVIKNVVGGPYANDPGHFSIHVLSDGVDLNNGRSPQPGLGGQGRRYDLIDRGDYIVTEDQEPGYTTSYSIDCNPLGVVRFTPNGTETTKTCQVTNTYDTSEPADLCMDVDHPGIQTSVPNGYYRVETSPGIFGCYPIVEPPIIGCTDPLANNYDPGAVIDSGLCRYGPIVIRGCTNPAASNYNPLATVDNGTCNIVTGDPTDTYGCMDPLALNYNSGATLPNNSCQYVHSDPTTPGTDYPPVPPGPGPGPLAFFGTNTDGGYGWWWPVISAIGLLSTLPAVISRFGNLILTLVFKRKRQRGIVYDAKTKEPLDPAYVSVIDIMTGKEVVNQITDMEGRYGFILKKGSYQLVANKTHYQFPSVLLAGKTSDEVYDHLYFGEVFTVTDEERVIDMNVPMDPVGTDWNQQEKRRTHFLRYLFEHQASWAWFLDLLFVIGFVVSIVITYYYPVWWNILMVALYIVIAFLEATGYDAVTIGKITRNGVPLAYAIIRVYNANLNHEVARLVTTEYGSYYVLVPKANYYITVEERNIDGTYTQVFTSEVMHAGEGIINKPFKI